ncbi:hypothetical protein DSM21852_12850 [Methylocystis bryophila]|nr:hypothetical protein DSM21852_12850 [Methylocystis bryophila]
MRERGAALTSEAWRLRSHLRRDFLSLKALERNKRVTTETFLRPPTLALLVVTGLVMGYYFWSLFVNSRYEALCNVNYWFASKEQIEACKEAKTELDTRR